jgi:hypothetical protein
MTKRNLALFVSMTIAAGAVETPLELPDAKIDMPPLTLVENSLQGLPGSQNDFGRAGTARAGRVVFTSRMPIIQPKEGIDPKMVKSPDPAVDYKLIVIAPDIAPAK